MAGVAVASACPRLATELSALACGEDDNGSVGWAVAKARWASPEAQGKSSAFCFLFSYLFFSVFLFALLNKYLGHLLKIPIYFYKT
jgi:hypothetical protein